MSSIKSALIALNLCAILAATGCYSSGDYSDVTPPISGSNGVITVSSITDRSITLNIAKAIDNLTTSEGLQYRVYYSTANNLDTVAAIEANGIPASAYTTTSNLAYGIVNGKVNGALNYDGSTQYVNISNSTDLNFGTGSFSVEAWVNSAAWVDLNGIISKGGFAPTEAGYTLRQLISNGRQDFQFVVSNGAIQVAAGISNNTTGSWYHLVGVLDRAGNTISLFVNGALASSVDIADFTGSTDSNLDLTIGKQANFFSGDMDEVALYNRALSPAEIAARYNDGNGLSVDPVMNGLVAGWSLDGNSESGAQVVDVLGYRNGTYMGNIRNIAVPVYGLNKNTTYYFNVIAKDAAYNKTAYATASISTLRLMPVSFRVSSITYDKYTPAVVDINNDGNLEALGVINDGTGNITTSAASAMGLQSLFMPGRVNRDCRLADFNGDGLQDIVCNTYQAEEIYTGPYIDTFLESYCPAASESYSPNGVALLFFQNPDGSFSEQASFTNMAIRGFGETILAADFNNDDALDIFIPHYSFCSPNEHSYLLINDGSGSFTDISDMAGVALRNHSVNFRVEGAQALDFNFDGWLDFYVGGHFFINNGCSGSPCNPAFADQRAALGLPELFDEGIKFLDWNNDGYLDILFHHPVTGPALYQFDGSLFALADVMPIFTFTSSDSYGMNVYDLNNDGNEDVITSGGSSNNTYVLLNNGSTFERATTSMDAWGNDMIAFGDINKDGKIDVIKSMYDTLGYGQNLSAIPSNNNIYIDVVGFNGEENQQGRVVKIMPQNHPDVIMTRIVESGSGFMAQNMYKILVGTPYTESHTIQVYFNSGMVSFTANPGDRKRVYQNGTVLTY